MFDQIKLEVGAVLIIIVLCIGGYFVWKYNHTQNELVTEQAANKQLVTSNAVDAKTIATVQKSDAITEATNDAVAKGTETTNNTTAAITADVDAKIAAIKQTYDNQAKSTTKPSGTINVKPVITAPSEDKAIAQTLIN